MNFVLIFLAILPGIIFLIFIYKIDRFNREPIGLLAKLFFVGIAAIAPAIVLEQIFLRMNLFQGYLGLAIEAFLIIGLTEEYLKRLAVKIVAYRSAEFDERLDGIVYCVVASLGFATLENVMYVIQYSQDMPYLWLSRALLAVPAHMLFGITMGYYLSMSKFCNNPTLSKKYASLSLWIPVFFHGLYDFFALSGSFVFLVLLIVLMIVMWVYNIKRLKIYIKESKVKKELTDRMMQ
ncbi:MAG: PrsW family intramembrane metalloprotease [Clostridia bacterium]|nr:PrsW family intramembrane metalloprotease [Clostridia bacterium]